MRLTSGTVRCDECRRERVAVALDFVRASIDLFLCRQCAEKALAQFCDSTERSVGFVDRANVPWSYCPLCGVRCPRRGTHLKGCPASNEGSRPERDTSERVTHKQCEKCHQIFPVEALVSRATGSISFPSEWSEVFVCAECDARYTDRGSNERD